MIKHIKNILVAMVVTAGLFSCEQERLGPVLTTADGGGTLNEYVAYDIESTDPTGSNVYGRIVFWKDNLDRTLVQVSLYNTIEGSTHPALIVSGAIGTETTTMLELDSVSGDSGELSASKFFVIADTSFYGSILEMDAHINIYLSDTDDTIVATGDLGANADPVESN
ncbi:hypothetical protein SAMN05421766_104645 [Zobellia uliginosa]|uniref:CHRD domain-containing protein n=1 Tax=Zobellia uliginosa TaxID=143224 RepID=A0ABY1KX98_9FLAO|nr:hypothetical protein [Zobellia uliginosa]SIS88780.1 hypothetical protein SAMN05421766_104645 [Zobellia uliginosa]